MFDQVGGGYVAAHAVAEQDDGQPGMILADVLVERGEVADHLAPAIAVGVVAEVAGFRGAPVAALVDGIEVVAGRVQRAAEPLVAASMLGHAVGQHHRATGGAIRRPVAGVQRRFVTGREPVGSVGHAGESLRRPGQGPAF
ncbi:hypothetical protein D3C76_836440 [compost metagenome]